MWLFLNNSFLSVVADAEHKGALLVRARREGDIENVIPGAKGWVEFSAEHDYPYRVRVNAETFAELIGDRIKKIHYTNFKDNVALTSNDRAISYSKVWEVMLRFYQKVQSKYNKRG